MILWRAAIDTTFYWVKKWFGGSWLQGRTRFHSILDIFSCRNSQVSLPRLQLENHYCLQHKCWMSHMLFNDGHSTLQACILSPHIFILNYSDIWMLFRIPRLPRVPEKTPGPKSSFSDYCLEMDYRNVSSRQLLDLALWTYETSRLCRGGRWKRFEKEILESHGMIFRDLILSYF